MLINTVLVFLQNILPIFVVFSLLFAQQDARYKSSSLESSQSSSQSRNQSSNQSSNKEKNNIYYLPIIYLLKTTGIGLIIVFLLSYFMPMLSQLFSGTGLEILFSILFSLIYCFIVISFLLNQTSSHKKSQDKMLLDQQTLTQQKTLVSLAILLLVLCVHGSYFSLYVMSLTIQNTALETLYSGIVVGVIIGTGICLSIAILLYFILVSLAKKLRSQIVCYFLLLFGVGQLIQGLQLLEQVDIISSTAHLWSTNYLIAEDSELGYFLTILFGYEATPSAMELIVYLSAIIVPILIAKINTSKQNSTASFMKGTS
ncbi:hypothetical protein ESZ36_19925 [Colwellia demingiae]|uniref:Iron permease n=1 Tax=Colwellia demingiae TaxID=89401 RepID=A0A5C6Q7J7_9GAMM|nr:hypothetical protein [Colwellia demingiae]TWX64567.1 hypothetical protein ESZ36_19925 [Colwellia demingiae]